MLFNEARALLTRAEHLTEAVHRAARGEQGHIAIGFTSSAALHPFVPNLLRRYREILPGITTQLEEAGSGELLDALVDERLDVAFVRSPVGGIPGLTIEPVLREPMLIALPIGHPLATHDDQPLPLTALTQEAFILTVARRARACMMPFWRPATVPGSARALFRRPHACPQPLAW